MVTVGKINVTTFGDRGESFLSQPHWLDYPATFATDFSEWTGDWTCEYCRSLHPGHEYACCNCGAARKVPATDLGDGRAFEQWFGEGNHRPSQLRAFHRSNDR